MVAPVAVSIRGLSHLYQTQARDRVEALRAISFDIHVGEMITIVGASGSGKSTLLNMIAGLMPATAGTITFPAFPTPPRIGYLFQRDAVFPWRDVARNLSYSLEVAGRTRAQRRQRAEELCRCVGLNPDVYLRKYPNELSGGELRRVGLGMALANTPDLLLLDEPTGAVDWLARRQLQAMIRSVVSSAGATAVYVTHDVEEAIWLGDKVLVLHAGKIAGTVEVDLDARRSESMRNTEQFRRLQESVIALLERPPLDGAAKYR